jgi:hypothetical protein
MQRFGMFLGLFAVSMLASPAYASTSVGSFQTDITLTACNGDFVEFIGDIHEVTAITDDSSGDRHFDETLTGHIPAVGSPSGSRYLLNLDSHESGSFPISPYNFSNTTMTLTFSSLVIAEGSAQNQLMKITTHTTLNTNGVVTVSFDKGTSVCR